MVLMEFANGGCFRNNCATRQIRKYNRSDVELAISVHVYPIIGRRETIVKNN